MTRVSTTAQNSVLLQQLMEANKRVFEAERQVSTGKVSDTYKGLASDLGVLMSAKNVEVRNEQFTRTSKMVLSRVDVQNTQMDELANIAQELREAAMNALANDNGLGFMEAVDSAFRRAVNVLNSQQEGRYIYGGTRSDVAPVNVTTLAELDAAASTADIFENSDVKSAVRIDDHVVVEYGFLASDLGTDLMDMIKQIVNFNNTAVDGPFDRTLTAEQRTFLSGQIGTLADIPNDINRYVSQNGNLYKEIENALERHESTETFIKSFIADIEDVDMGEAVVKLNQDQIALQATAQVLAQTSRITLLDFL